MAYRCGIYCIQNQTNGKRYIGSSTRIQKRKKNHFYTLRKGNHWNAHLQSAFLKYGQESFLLTILEECDASDLIPREQFWINWFDSANPSLGYNLNPLANLERHTEESKRKISESNKRRYQEGRIPYLLGKTHSDEVKAKLGNLHRGKTVSLETRLKLRQAHTGKTLSAEHRRRIGDATRGKKQPQWLVEKRTKFAKRRNRPIVQYDQEGNLVAEFSGVLVAAQQNGVYAQGIMDCAKGRRSVFKGFSWRYKEAA